MEKGISIEMRGGILAASVLAVLLLTGSSYAQIPDAPSETTQAVLSPQQRQWLEGRDPIRIGVTFIPPQVLRDHQNGTLSGLCIDFMNEIEKTLPCRFEVVYFDTWAAMMEAALAREIDVIYAAQKTPSRKEAFLFTQPYLDFDNKIVTRQDTEGPLTLEDLAGKTVTVVKGAAIEEYLQGDYPKIRLLGVDDELEGLTRVSFNQADAMVIEIARASWYIQQKKFTNLHIAGDTDYIYRLGFACRSDWPELRDILDAGLASISPKRRNEIINNWVPLFRKGVLDTRLVIAAVVGIALILMAIFVWNRMLKRQVHRRTLELNQEIEAHEKDFAILKRFETIISLSDDLMVFVDRDFVYRAANEAYLKTVNKTHVQVIGQSVADVAGRELFDSFLRPRIEEALNGKIVTYERWFDFDHIGKRYLQAVYHPYKNAAGVIEGIVVVLHDITDQKRAEQLLRDSEERFHSLFEQAPLGYQSLDANGMFIAVNKAWLETLGYTRQEVLGKWFGDFLAPEYVDAFRKRFPIFKAEGRIQSEFYMRHKDGSRRFIAFDGRIGYKHDGSFKQTHCILKDETERKRTEQLLKDSEQRLRSLFVASPVGIGLVKDRVLFSVNQRICEMTGYTEQELIGQNSRMLYPTEEEYRYVGTEKYRQIEQTGIGSVESRWRRKDGRIIDVLISSSPLDMEHREKGTSFTVMDITDRRRAEEANRLNQERLDTLVTLNSMTDADERKLTHFAMEAAVKLTGSTIGYIAFVNEDETVLTMYAWSKQAMRECAVIDKPTTYPVASTGLWGESIRQRKAVITNDYAAPNSLKKGLPDGHVHIKRHLNAPAFDGGRIVIVAGVGNKPTDYGDEDVRQLSLLMSGLWIIIRRKQAEEEREKLLRELQNKNEELDSILFIASHDLKGPLVNVQGFAGELEKSLAQLRAALADLALDDAARDKLAVLLETDIPESLYFIKGGSQKINGLIDGLLRLSRVGAAGLNPTLLDINAMIGDIIGNLRFKIRENDIDIAVEETLPPCPGDATLIKQVFANLVENAVKYRQPDRPCRIRIRGCKKDNHCLYQVEDNGIGIAPEHTEKVFELFHQLNPGRGGEGLGLTIVRRVLDRMGGTVRIDSEVGKGTTVSVVLPCKG